MKFGRRKGKNMHAILCRIKEEQKEWLEEISFIIGNYIIICCQREIIFKLDREKQKKKCKECGKLFEVTVEGYIACVN